MITFLYQSFLSYLMSFLSYGFRTKEIIPLTGADIRVLIEKGGLVFKYLAEGEMDKLTDYLKYNPLLNEIIEKWVKWSEDQLGGK